MEPGKCFVGGGLWHPEGDAVHKLRASIDERPRRWRRVLCDPAFRRTFLPEAKAKKGKGKDAELEDQKAVLKAFTESNKENALKTKPKVSSSSHGRRSCRRDIKANVDKLGFQRRPPRHRAAEAAELYHRQENPRYNFHHGERAGRNCRHHRSHGWIRTFPCPLNLIFSRLCLPYSS